MADVEPTFTLDEAAMVLARRECAIHGHNFDIVVKFGGEPLSLHCDCCHESWKVEASDAG